MMVQEQIDFSQGVIACYMDLDEWNPKLTKGGRTTVRHLQDLVDESNKKKMRALEDKKE